MSVSAALGYQWVTKVSSKKVPVMSEVGFDEPLSLASGIIFERYPRALRLAALINELVPSSSPLPNRCWAQARTPSPWASTIRTNALTGSILDRVVP